MKAILRKLFGIKDYVTKEEKPEQVEAKEIEKTVMGDFESRRQCLECGHTDGKYNTEVCRKCGGNSFDIVVGQIELVWYHSGYGFGMYIPLAFHIKQGVKK